MLATGSLQQEKARTPYQPAVLRRARKDNKLRFLFAYRLAQYLDACGGLARRHARRMQQRLNLKYGVDIDIGAQIAPGLRIAHLPGVVITRYVSIGRNFFIRQNCSIGIKTWGCRSTHCALVTT
jgi:serine acetyltransferase